MRKALQRLKEKRAVLDGVAAELWRIVGGETQSLKRWCVWQPEPRRETLIIL
jgi:hypothetical protein